MLSAKNITYSINNKLLLDDVSVEFYPGKFNIILGPNGAGKSTLIGALSGKIFPQTGEVSYSGKLFNSFTINDLAKIRAVLSQNTEIAFPLKVSQVVMMGRYPFFSGEPSPVDISVCEEAMRFFDIQDMAERDFTTLSGGEKQRVHFARVLAQIWNRQENIRYLILDEPLASLDVYYQYHFMNKIKEFLNNKDVVVVGIIHDLNIAGKYADQIVLMNKGKIFAKGDKKEVLTNSNIKNVYGIEPKSLDHSENFCVVF